MVLALSGVAPFLVGGGGRLDAFDERVLASHNREREAAGVSPLVWDTKLADQARSWAEHLAKTHSFEHSDADDAGENLWAGTSGGYSPEEMVGLWVAEKTDYKPGIFPYVSRSENLDAVGHYTQLIWGQTHRLGCALADGGDEEILVCRYQAAGNVIGERVT